MRKISQDGIVEALEGELSMKRKRGYSRWSEEEEAALRIGVARYGEGKWKRILCDDELSEFFVDRSNVDLKDKWRTMMFADRAKPTSGGRGASADTTASDTSAALCSPGPAPAKPPVAPCTSPQEQDAKRPCKPFSLSARAITAKAKIPAIVSKADQTLCASLEAAKRRHNGTTGQKAHKELQRELLLEVWKAVSSHPGITILSRVDAPDTIAAGLAALRQSLSENAIDVVEFYQQLMGIINTAKHTCGSAAETARLDSLRVATKRSFEVLCLSDDAYSVSLLPLLAPQARSKYSRSGRSSKASKPVMDEEDELIAVGVLNMIREGSASAGTSVIEPSERDKSERGEPEASSAPDASPKSANQPVTYCLPPETPQTSSWPSSPMVPPTSAVVVPEGCGLQPTMVSAALHKASKLLTDTESVLLPVKDLGLSNSASLANGSANLFTMPNSCSIHLSSPLSLPSSMQLITGQSLMVPLATPSPVAVDLRGFSILPTSTMDPLISVSSKLPSIINSIPMGTESWYPAYMAWVYSGMVNSHLQVKP